MNAPLLQIEALGISLSGRAVLSDIHLSVEAGDYVSVIGPNGAGKTTLIKCIAGIHDRWSGSIRLAGRPYADFQTRERARLLAYVPQAEGRTTPLTVREFVALGRYPHLSAFTLLSAADHRAIETAVECAGIEAIRHRSMNTLSGGERQMVFIAAALAQEARLLLLDEPSTFLDYRHQQAVSDLLQRVRSQQQLAILAVHHDINTALQASTRIQALKNGRTVFSGTPEELADPARLEAVYDTPFTALASDERPVPFLTAGGRA